LRERLAVVLFVLLLRVPFLNQAVQGDDPYYLYAAQHAQIDPAHPGHVSYVFQGERVSMQGHPHPPGNAWVLGALLALLGDVRERPFHAAYIPFSLIAGLAALSLARRFCARALAGTLLFLVTPAFIVNGNSFETDVPFVSLWLLATACFILAVDRQCKGWLAGSVIAMGLAAMMSFQSIVLVPILGLYLWQHGRGWRAAWLALLMIPFTLAAWQGYEKLVSDRLPAEVLSGYFKSHGLQTKENKIKNAAAMVVHLGWMVFPALPLAMWKQLLAFVPPLTGLIALVWAVKHRRDFLVAWALIFFAAALVLFYAGSVRYLLPIALPVALLVTRLLEKRPVALAGLIILQGTLGLALAKANYDHWDGYRRTVAQWSKDWENKRVWMNAELGLRFYAESAGALPVERGQSVRPGDLIVTSKLTEPVDFTTGGGVRVAMAEVAVTSRLPFRLIGLGSRSAYSTAAAGFLPFDYMSGPIDVVRLETVAERKPVLSYLPMSAPEAEAQIVSGVYKLEENRYRWMGRRAVVLLRRPERPGQLEVDLHVPDQAPARKAVVSVDGIQVADRELKPGRQQILAPGVAGSGDSVTVAIELDRTYSAAGDQRVLGAVLGGVGFRE
jgi:hypothetical protein